VNYASIGGLVFTNWGHLHSNNMDVLGSIAVSLMKSPQVRGAEHPIFAIPKMPETRTRQRVSG
jgi:hypothetical protein